MLDDIFTRTMWRENMIKVAPTLIVDRIEPTMHFMIEQLGFCKVAEVPGKNG